MDALDGGRRRSLKERLGFKGIGCCGPTWGFRPTTISVRDEEEDDSEQQIEIINSGYNPVEINPDPYCFGPVSFPSPMPSPTGMNLAAALAAERRLRSSPPEIGGGTAGPTHNEPGYLTAPATPSRVSLMRLLEETDGGEAEVAEKKREEGVVGSDSVCCVCMGRKKGAAFIPCGHTFCRVCSRELWLNRGSCPLCNRPILEILDIF